MSTGIVISPEGAVSKDGKNLGTIKDGVMYHTESISGVVKGQIRDHVGNEELKFDPRGLPQQAASAAGASGETTGSPGGGQTAANETKVVQPEQKGPVTFSPTNEELFALVKARGLIPEFLSTVVGVDQLRELAGSMGAALVFHDQATPPPVGRLGIESATARAVAENRSPCPPFDSSAGDKTPAVVEWMRLNATPEEFDAQYGNRHIALKGARPTRQSLPNEQSDD